MRCSRRSTGTSIVDELVAWAAVFVAAAVPWLEVLLVVPAGVLAGLSPVGVVVVGAAGNVATLVPAVLGADRARRWSARRRSARRGALPLERGEHHSGVPGAPENGGGERAGGSPAGGRRARANRIVERFGVPGAALLGPATTGVHVAALVAVAAGADRRRTLVWCSAGVVIWAVVAAGATVLGIDAFVDADQLPGLPGT
jgi:uncharacterized membrane protein